MKKVKLILIPIVLTFLVLISSCSNDDGNPSVNNPFVGGYSSIESRECMTLATITYTAENDTAHLRDSLIIQLGFTNYATGGKWKLTWGPCLSPDGGNLMYVVKDTSANPVRYAIAIRGTDWCFPFNWKEDLGAIDFVKYPYSNAIGDSISGGAMNGMNRLLAMTDHVSGQTIAQYLTSIQASGNPMYITGHSLGGMLATVFTSWFLDNGYGQKFKLKTYTFAAPSAGNQEFADHYAALLSGAEAESHRVVNPKDIVHYFYNDVNQITQNNIPTEIPTTALLALIAIESYFQTYNMVYVHVGQKQELSSPPSPSCGGGSGTLENYECWVGYEHTTNTYLSLIGAPLVNLNDTPCKWE